MPTENVNITDTDAEFIRLCVESGDYNDASELYSDALRLLKVQQEEQRARVDSLRAEIQKGYDARVAGRTVDISTKELRAAYFEDVNRRGPHHPDECLHITRRMV